METSTTEVNTHKVISTSCVEIGNCRDQKNSDGRQIKKRGKRKSASKTINTTEKRTKYENKRLTTNRRERKRQRELNVSFQELRKVIPTHPRDAKLSKFAMLQGAIRYIRFLRNLLSDMGAGSTQTDYGEPHQSLQNETHKMDKSRN